MQLVLAALVLCACGGASAVAVENRGGAARPGCDLPPRIERHARRYANLDADDVEYQVWSSWRVGLQFRESDGSDKRLRGTIAMVGDDLTWTFDFVGDLDEAACKLELTTDTHEPIWIDFDLRVLTGRIRSIDDVWLLGPPFPKVRP